jgi:twitching motility protein PilT
MDTQVAIAENYFNNLIDLAITKGASDIHMPARGHACLRIDGELIRINDNPPSPEAFGMFLTTILKDEQIEKLDSSRDVDFVYIHGKIRFRGNAFFQQRGLSVSLRMISEAYYTIDDLGLPEICKYLCKQNQGLIIFVGPTGCGKSTSLAAMINYINKNRALHIITVEDPVEYVFQDEMSTIEQREVHYDAISFKSALRAAMRQDPDVLMVGEMRDLETIRSAVTMAETGHLVFGTLHTNSAPLALDRLIDVFPADQQAQIRMQLSTSISAIISQRLIPLDSGGRVLAYEVMIANDAVRNLIRDQKIYQLPNVIQTSAQDGMISYDRCLAELVLDKIISIDIGRQYAHNKEEFEHLVKKTPQNSELANF